jgi:hypothetical protein
MDYYFVAQGKTTIPNVNDGEELELTDVSPLVLLDICFFSIPKPENPSNDMNLE